MIIAATADDGTVGYGEAVANPGAVASIVDGRRGNTKGSWDRDVQDVVIGASAVSPDEAWQVLRDSTFWSCYSGAGYVALAGVDMALWDLAGKLRERPLWQLLTDAPPREPASYVTVYHGAGSLAETIERTTAALARVKEAGFTAAKVEALPRNAPGERDPFLLAAAAREVVGDDFDLLLDLGYRWDSVRDAGAALDGLDQLGLYALEAPFPPRRIDEYKRLAESIRTPIAAGDMLSAPTDYTALVESGTLRFVQAGAGRTGISGMRELAHHSSAFGCDLIPWGWSPTVLTTAANVHVAVASERIGMVEYAWPGLYPERPLRNALLRPEPSREGGVFCVPEAAGLGLVLDEELLAHHLVPERRMLL